ncbi:acyltransferase family protein [Rugamonas sp. FT107W]|uniref:Acyltransferase family protein n=1 Tax=Duganella vulcania TaxID=2692166 RepID=A0A845HG15_9BURK|nr:acyltransferase family protein [Duganella vulcania]MYN17691.1 acyltransferase family protein [Duganella vulcania]
MDFRRDINGLRALAVLAVILYHFNSSWLPGGFAGVDVFFVISGYLMTSIVYRGLSNQTLSVLKFYMARGRRIIPALLVPCLLLLVAGWFFFLPSEYLALGKHVAASLGFVSNMVYWKESSYFAAGAHEKWLLHTWSLSVEWQFYLIYPVCMLLLNRWFGLRRLRWILLVGAAIGFAVSAYASSRWPDGAFFLLPSRAWEMMAGGLALLFPLTLTPARARLVEWTGLALIAGSYIALSENDIWPGYLALLPVTGAALIIAANRQTSLVTDNALFQWLGNISYSLYIWHWPVVVTLAYLGRLDNLGFQLAGIAAALIFAQLSYWFVEQKMRVRMSPRWSASWISGAVAVCALGLAVLIDHGVVTPTRAISVSDRARFVAEYDQKYLNLHTSHWIDKCNIANALTVHGTLRTDDVCTRKSGEGGVFLWGDSHAEALSFGLRKTLPAGMPFYQVTSSGCRPSVLVVDVKQKGLYKVACDYANALAMKKIAENRPEIVIVAQQKNHEKTDWQEFASTLKSLGVSQVVLVGPVPQWQPSLPIVVVNRHWGDTAPYITDAALDQNIVRTNARLKVATAHENITFVPLIDSLCNNNACLARVTPDNALLLVDYGHLSEEGSLYVVKNLLMPHLASTSHTASLN